MTNDTLVKEAIDTVNDIFADTSVTAEQTVERLNEILEHIEDCIHAIEEDLDGSDDHINDH